ncbi:2110_t:CDS:2, partial [Entrophospora sp. SA101]
WLKIPSIERNQLFQRNFTKLVLNFEGLVEISKLSKEWATNRQVSNIKYALQHNLGLGGAVVISIYKKPKFFSLNNNVDGRKRLGYNPAIESKGITTNDLDKVKSKSDYSNWFYSKL